MADFSDLAEDKPVAVAPVDGGFDFSDLGELADAPAQVDPDMEAANQTLGEQMRVIRERELAERAKRQQDPRRQDIGAGEFVRGVRAGLAGTKIDDPTAAASMGAVAGEYGPLAAGSIAAASMTGGSSLLASAAAQFAGVSAGEAAKKATSKALGDRPDSNLRDDITDIGAMGLGAAMTDLGLGVLGKAASVLPEFAATYLKVPAEAIKRALQRPYAVETGGPSAQLAVENKAVNVLGKIQDHIGQLRKTNGEAVEKALEGLYTKTKGEKVFDLRPLSDDLEKFVKEGMGGDDSTIKALMAKDYTKIMDLIKTMRKDPMKNARTMVQIRRELDKLQSFKFGGVPQVNSEVGELAIKRLAGSFRDTIEEAGKKLNYGELTSANSKFHEFSQDYDSLRKMVGTDDKSRLSMITKVDMLERFFNKGGLRQDLIQEIGVKYPEMLPQVEELMDILASRSFTRHSVGTPSGNIKDLARALVTPQNLAKTIKASQSLPVKAGKVAAGTSAKIAGAEVTKNIVSDE